MKKLLFPVFLVLTVLSNGQNYTTSVSTGLRQFVFELRPNARLAYPPPKDDVLSDWQTIPFPWKFYGKDVTGFYISDNGYITFDNAATVSVPANTTLPLATAPRNAIFAFWEDLHTEAGFSQWSNEVRVLEWGTAPNRVLLIMWAGVVPPGVTFSSSNTLAFGIALFEGGDFDVIFVGGRSTVRMNATVGAQNADGTAGVMLDGSPTFGYPAVTADPNDDISYAFSYSNSATDLALDQHFLQPTVKASTPVSIKGVVKNTGTQTVGSYDLSWSVDGAAPQTETISGLSLESNRTATFTHTVPWTPSEAGRLYQIRMWISNVNGGAADLNQVNDTLSASVLTVLGRSGTKRVLVEEFTGAWCGWCPDGGLQMATIEAQMPEAVLMAIHAGGTDSMIVDEGAALSSFFRPSYPQAMIDRTMFPGQTTVPINRSNSAWLNRALQQAQLETPVDIVVTPSYDNTTRLLTAKVRVNFIDYLPPDPYRLNVVVVEDRVTGAGRGYDQSNYYSGNASYPNHPYYGESNPILGFVHRHVPRAFLTGTWGEDLPTSVPAGDYHERLFSFTLPEHVKTGDVEIVAFVTRHGVDLPQRSVVNAGHAPLMPADVETIIPARLNIGAPYPNPAASSAVLRVELPASESLRVDVVDALGRVVLTACDARFSAGGHVITVPVHMLAPGSYQLRATAGGTIAARTLLITGR